MNSELQKAIEDESLSGVIAALDKGADIDAKDMHGHPGLPLRLACFLGHAGIVGELLRRGADPQVPNAQGPGAPLRIAHRLVHDAVVRLLESHSVKAAAPAAATDTDERRKRKNRRSLDLGPPQGMLERRCGEDRRALSIGFVDLDDNLWDSYFTQSQAQALAMEVESEANTADHVFAKVRD